MTVGSRWKPWTALAALALAAGLTAAAAPPAANAQTAEEGGGFTLTILHNNDGESKLLPDEDSSYPGAARFAALMKQLQAEASGGGVITLTSGDNFLASQELSVSLGREGPLYDSVALSGLYDAMALGNHDFDLGPEVTARFITGFSPAIPFLSANVDFTEEPDLQALVDQGLIAASTVVETGGERIGVVGAVTPMLANISSPRNAVVSDVLPAVSAAVDGLESQDVDQIILVSHLQDVAEEIELTGMLSGVDVVIAGGGDDLLANEGDTCMPDEEPAAPYPDWTEDADGTRVPVITAPGGYRCIGELNVTFDADGNVTAAQGRSIGVGFDVTPDPAVQEAVIDPLSAAVAAIDADVIGTSEVELDGRRAMIRTGATNEGNLMADALRAAAVRLAGDFGSPVPDAAIQNGGGIRNDSVIPAGDITAGDTWDIAPFRNFAVVGEVPRETFRDLLEQAVDRIPGAGGQFAQVSGFTFTYDPSAPAREIARDGDCSLTGDPGGRVQDVVLDDGTVIVEDGEVAAGGPVALATIDFLAGGGDCYPLADIDFTNLGVSYQQALADYITEDLNGVITAEAYPAGGGGRITALEPAEEETTEEETSEEETSEEETSEEETTEEEPSEEEPSEEETTEEETSEEETTEEETSEEEPAEGGEEPPARQVQVAAGDYLRKIAQDHLGDENRWPEIYALNRGRVQADGRALTDPDLIHIGWRLLLP